MRKYPGIPGYYPGIPGPDPTFGGRGYTRLLPDPTPDCLLLWAVQQGESETWKSVRWSARWTNEVRSDEEDEKLMKKLMETAKVAVVAAAVVGQPTNRPHGVELGESSQHFY